MIRTLKKLVGKNQNTISWEGYCTWENSYVIQVCSRNLDINLARTATLVRELNQLIFFWPNFINFSFVWNASLFSPTECRNASCVSSYVPNLSFALRCRWPHNAAVLPEVLPKVLLLSCCEDVCNTSSKYFPSAAPSVKIPLIIVCPSLASTCPWKGSLTLLPICCTILQLCDPKKGILPRLRVSITQYLVDDGGCDSQGTSRILIGASLCKSKHAPIVVFKSLELFVFLCFLLGRFCKLVSLIARNKLFIMPPASSQVFHTVSVYYPNLFRLIVALAWVPVDQKKNSIIQFQFFVHLKFNIYNLSAIILLQAPY